MNIIFLVLIFYNFININSNIHLKFRRYTQLKTEYYNITLEEFIEHRTKNIFKTIIYLGEPSQEIPGFLETNEHCFLISNNDCLEKNIYEKEKSESFSYSNNNQEFLQVFIPRIIILK